MYTILLAINKPRNLNHTSDMNILLFLAIGYFTVCTISIVHLFFFYSNREIKKSILIYSLTYAGLNSAFEIFKCINTPNHGVNIAGVIGGTIGIFAGFYLGHQACVLAGSDPKDISNTTVVIIIINGEFGLQIGSFFGNILLPI